MSAHRQRWTEPEIIARAPGRVNIIGEHTDYNEGFALPMALPFDTVVALSTTGDSRSGRVMITAEGFGTATFGPTEPEESPTWARHVAGVVADLAAHGIGAGGWAGTIASDVPIGAGLSSSAAIEVAMTLALLGRAGLSWSPVEVARVGQRVENRIVGVPTGIMDQLISAGAVHGHASLMDCRSLTLEPTPMPSGATIAILDTMTRRTLVDGQYGDRRRSCERASAALGITALRDAMLTDLERLTDATDIRRARHIITENDRTVAAAAAMRADDPVELGRLMSQSHRSLRDDFDVSGPGLDAIVDIAINSPGCLGARMTGGGFAGCAVALIETGARSAFVESVIDRYDHDGLTAEIWLCSPAAGAGLVDVG